MKKDVAIFHAWVCISSCIGVLYLTARCTRRKNPLFYKLFFSNNGFFKALSHSTWHLLFRLFWRQSAEFFQVFFTVRSLDFSTWEGPKIPIWRIHCQRRLVFGLLSFFEAPKYFDCTQIYTLLAKEQANVTCLVEDQLHASLVTWLECFFVSTQKSSNCPFLVLSTFRIICLANGNYSDLILQIDTKSKKKWEFWC